jgi:SNF2 family DNA or RNA helicase
MEAFDFSSICLNSNFKLNEHQKDAITFIQHRFENERCGINGGFLALDPGLQKTLISLSLLIYNRTKYKIQKSLVIVPKNLINEWKNEIEKFFGDNLSYKILHKNYEKNLNEYSIEEDIKKGTYIFITTYDVLVSFDKKLKVSNDKEIFYCKKPNDDIKVTGGNIFFKLVWDILVCDESHIIGKNKKFKSLLCLYANKKVLLTGTPINNGNVLDYYSQFRVLGLDVISIPRDFNLTLYEKFNLANFVYRKNYTEAGIVLPDLFEENVYIDLKDEEAEIYDYYQRSTQGIYRDCILNKTQKMHVYHIFTRLRQISIAPSLVMSSKINEDLTEEGETAELNQKIYEGLPTHLKEWIKKKKGTAGIKSAKMKKMCKIIKEKVEKGEKTIVFTDFVKAIETAEKAMDYFLPDVKYSSLYGKLKDNTRVEIIENFREDDETKVLFISNKLGNAGLNLQVANNIIFLNNWWNPCIKKQAFHRSYRPGQKKEVHIYNLLVKTNDIIKNSIELNIAKIADDKNNRIDEFLNNNKKKKEKNVDTYMLGKILGLGLTKL